MCQGLSGAKITKAIDFEYSMVWQSLCKTIIISIYRGDWLNIVQVYVNSSAVVWREINYMIWIMNIR